MRLNSSRPLARGGGDRLFKYYSGNLLFDIF